MHTHVPLFVSFVRVGQLIEELTVNLHHYLEDVVHQSQYVSACVYVVMRDEEGRKKKSNTAHPRQSLFKEK